ncbi:hypothetical protein BBP40_008094 [Aspergillus hancockii]|nr:hypothetical protein BBP40_008094 [Aspergillus hancockii]
MASIVQRPLNRIRKTDSYHPLHERWGDVTISAPTEGSWNQVENPHRSSRRRHGHGSVIKDYDTRPARERSDTTLSTEEFIPPRQGSPFSMSKLNPRRLSMRLAPRSKQATEHQHERRTEFAYKPYHQDYPTEVAEKSAHDSPRFRYIPASSRYPEDVLFGSPCNHRFSSSSGGSVQSHYSPVEERDSRSRRHHRHSHHEEKDDHYVEPYDRSLQSSRSGNRSSSDHNQQALSEASSSLDKKRLRAARRMTMTMVPDSDDIYG